MATVSLEEAYRMALASHHANDRETAKAIYARILEADPNHDGAINHLGVIAAEESRYVDAIELLRRAIELRPDKENYHRNLAVALRTLGRVDEAADGYRRSLALEPERIATLNDLGDLLRTIRRFDEAIECHRRAQALEPANPATNYLLGTAYWEAGRTDESIPCFRGAIAVRPDYASAHYNLGVAALALGWGDEAQACFERAIEIEPDAPDALTNLGNCHHAAGRLDDAVEAHRRAVAVRPDFATGRFNLGLALLARGDFREGWAEYEWRRQFLSVYNFDEPMWDGSPLGGRTILIHAEQGFGDIIQFFRFLEPVARAGGRIVAEYPNELRRLLHNAVAEHVHAPRGKPMPPFDVHCPLLSLPRVLGTTLETIPSPRSYLKADAAAAARWRERIGDRLSTLNVGIVWAGHAKHQKDRLRSISPERLAPLADIAGVRLFSLQKRMNGAALPVPRGFGWTDWTDELGDFADTAALIDALDLVVSVDTSVAHLAGALGKPVWTLLPFSPDWRWLTGRDDSPWYPTMRLFRQPAIGDWDAVIARVAEALVAEIASAGSRLASEHAPG